MKLVGAVILAMAAIISTGCPNSSRNDSIRLKNEGTAHYAKKQWESAIERYQRATEKWHENHTAWYELSLAYTQRRDWDKAAEAAQTAVQIVPDQVMYQQNYGYILYERAKLETLKHQADKEGKKPNEVVADYSNTNFEKSLQHLQEAVKLNNDLWYSHYLIGSIYRFQQKPKEDAAELTKALESGPIDPSPWVALAELYRQWDYTDAAIQVAEQGIAAIPGKIEKSDVWYEVGAGYDEKKLDDKAIKAFDDALEARRDNSKAKFARGQAYFRKGDYAKAKTDLEEFSKAGGGASNEFFKQQASTMLMQIAAKSAPPPTTPTKGGPAEKVPGAPGQKMSPEDVVKKSKEGKKT